ncbi:hypothetical protein HK100_004758 [Physocladia obscura]|uniref:Uncharacterized protein n=1 Tax=Physocladia obscura TaxID=109957 RepID=A0AAD5XHG2_9FUNG|nr:hypothetical protein HK100_004758 [Physocladia obscura]
MVATPVHADATPPPEEPARVAAVRSAAHVILVSQVPIWASALPGFVAQTAIALGSAYSSPSVSAAVRKTILLGQLIWIAIAALVLLGLVVAVARSGGLTAIEKVALQSQRGTLIIAGFSLGAALSFLTVLGISWQVAQYLLILVMVMSIVSLVYQFPTYKAAFKTLSAVRKAKNVDDILVEQKV